MLHQNLIRNTVILSDHRDYFNTYTCVCSILFRQHLKAVSFKSLVSIFCSFSFPFLFLLFTPSYFPSNPLENDAYQGEWTSAILATNTFAIEIETGMYDSISMVNNYKDGYDENV